MSNSKGRPYILLHRKYIERTGNRNVVALCILVFKKFSFSSGFSAQVGDFRSKTVLVESEETYSDLRATGNRAT